MSAGLVLTCGLPCVKITSLETELLEVQKDKAGMSGEEQAASGAQEMQEVRGFPWERNCFV